MGRSERTTLLKIVSRVQVELRTGNQEVTCLFGCLDR